MRIWRVLAVGVLAAGSIALLPSSAGGARVVPAVARASSTDPGCTGNYGGAAPVSAAQPLRFGVDPGIAGSVGGAQLPTVPDDPAKDVSFSSQLRPAGHVLVVRLNRLFWSGGDPLIGQFQTLVAEYAKAGLQVELQVRYHPPSGQDGNLQAWQAYVRHVVDVFGPDPNVVAMTITNEVNVSFSPNTSDGSYTAANDALIQGIEAAHAEAITRGYRQLQFGFTYAYRFSPVGDTAFFSYLGTHGGSALRQALGFVGVDFYPGSVYPLTMGPTDTYRGDTAQALGTVRDCLMPLAALDSTVPIWITENGIPTGASTAEAQQASGLTQLVDAARDYSGTFNVTDYRWFNLRDSNSSDAAGSLPGVATTFTTDGLLRDDYTPKPAFAAYRDLIGTFGRPTAAPLVSHACRLGRFRIGLQRERRPIRRADVYLGRTRVGDAVGPRLRTVALRKLPTGRFTVRIVLTLTGGRRTVYVRRYRVIHCRLIARP
ncbi:MAG: hypothetical protein ABI355_09715 [Solirubrobacteraceae bacterium]